MSDLMHVSLFAGVGGADLGMEAAGIPTVAAVEIDGQARGVLARRFPHAALFSDVREVTGDDLRAAGAVPERTILSGGFPCQPFSVAGRRGGMGGDDERGDLYWQISRLVAEFPARWLVLENVPGLLSIDGGRTMGTILWDLGERGYRDLAYRVLDARFFGVPQRRRRVFIVGRLGDGARAGTVLLEPESGSGDIAPRGAAGPGTAGRAEGGAGGPGVFQCHGSNVGELGTVRAGNGGVTGGVPFVSWVKTVRSGARDENGDLPPEVWESQDVAPTLNVFDNGGESRATVLAVTAFSSKDHGADAGDIAPTLRAMPHDESHANGGGQVAVCVTGTVAHTLRAEGADASEDGTGRGTPIVAFHQTTSNGMGVATSTVRRLTPVECERLMGWPDGHTSHRVDFKTGRVVPQADSSRYKQVGNGMAAPVVEWIARRILAVEAATEDT